MKQNKILTVLLIMLIVLLLGCKTVYTITYDLDEGKCCDLVTSFKKGEDVKLPTPNKTGYTFLGWFEDEKKVDTIEDKNYNLTAKWQKDQYDYERESCKIANGDFLLDGELVMPKSTTKVKCVVIVAGSGPSNMDGTVGMQSPYKDLSEQLAKCGIASLRYNKVTYQYQNEIKDDYDFSIEDEYLTALYNAIDLVKQDKRIDEKQIYLVGHSLGSQIIPVALNNDSTLAGGIIMAGTTMHMLMLLLEQIKAQSIDLYNTYKDPLTRASTLTSIPPNEEKYFYFGAYTAYYVSYNKIDLQMVKDITQPLLIMQGGLDIQVKVSHFTNYQQLLKEKTNVTFKLYDKLNHLFSNGENETLETAYTKDNKIDGAVVSDIVAFVN